MTFIPWSSFSPKQTELGVLVEAIKKKLIFYIGLSGENNRQSVKTVFFCDVEQFALDFV